MTSTITISAKNLGSVALPGFCPRCFWIKLRLRNRLPYQIFPGIFSSIDAYSKHLIHSWFDRHNAPPPWLSPLGELTSYRNPPHYTKYSIHDEAADITLRGSPDAIFTRPDGSTLIVDYKTSRHTKYQDMLYPMYEGQLNAYARIGEACGYGPVSGLVLLYTEPLSDAETADQDAHHREEGFVMGFSAHAVEVTLNTAMLDPLLATVRQIHDLPASPDPREGCKDCERLADLVEVAGG